MSDQVDICGMVCDWLAKSYAVLKADGIDKSFDQWLLGAFDSYHGGATPRDLNLMGWKWFGFSPKGIELLDTSRLVKVDGGVDWVRMMVPKDEILKRLRMKNESVGSV